MLKKCYVLILLTIPAFSINAMNRPNPVDCISYGSSSTASCRHCGLTVRKSNPQSHRCYTCNKCGKIGPGYKCSCPGAQDEARKKAQAKAAKKKAARETQAARAFKRNQRNQSPIAVIGKLYSQIDWEKYPEARLSS